MQDQRFENYVEDESESKQSILIPISSALETAFSDISEIAERGKKCMGVRTGFRDLDNVLQGFRFGEYAVLTTDDPVDKTMLLVNIALGAARQNVSVVF